MRRLVFLGLALGCSTTASGGLTEAPVSATPTPAAMQADVRAPLTADVPADVAAPLLLRNARLIDGTGAAPQEGVDVRLEGGRIAEIGRGLVATGGRQIDLGGRTLLPGFIDAHVHLSFNPEASYDATVRKEMQATEADRALEGAANARATLRAGFTTVRVVGGGFSDRALRDAVAAGFVAGPRMVIANHAIGITGGHCDGTNSYHPGVMPDAEDYRHGVADGVEEVRKAVRYQVKHGADVIKICATGGVMSQGDTVGAPQLTPDEMRAAVDEAVRADRRVAAHAHGTAGIIDAVKAGVHSIEHGSILDDEAVRLLKARGTYLVPTTYVGRHVERLASTGTMSPESAAKAKGIAPKMRASFAKAYASGVKIALGSDAGVFQHGVNGREFSEMVKLGMKPMDAIVAGTKTAAELLGLDGVGTVEAGSVADLVVVDGDPLADITVVEAPAMVVQSGAVVVEPGWGAGPT